ncbi:ventricular zone expressed PH domain-containing protein melted [Lycorma delicatula]|uniref:ventricular zone expressed PH domain-containing protein melted n=1 Tax=Lycorma delicatula TaxID=130591 RepID=UPI003F50F15F
MHELFTQVLSKKDLSKAGDLFSVADQEIVNDLTEVVNTIAEITSLPDYVHNDNDQSVVEICITRVTSAIRETGSIEQHADALVALLESCLNHNLKPSTKDEDPPHAKISSDIISCIFLNYGKKDVMRRVLPVAVKFLHKGNRELSRNITSYLSLAAIENADLLSKHIQLIIDSIISGNYPLCRVLPQIYVVTKEPVHDHAMALVSLLPLCDHQEKLALLQLFALIADNKPALLEPSLPQLCEYLGTAVTANATMIVLLHLAEKRPQLLADYVPKIKQAADCHPNTLCLAAQVIAAVGKLSKDRAQEALNFVLEHLPKADRGSHGTLIREATLLCSSYPVLFTEKMIAQVRKNRMSNSNAISGGNNNQVNQTLSGVTIVKVGGNSVGQNNNTNTTNTNSTSTTSSTVSTSTSANNTVANAGSNINSIVTSSNHSNSNTVSTSVDTSSINNTIVGSNLHSTISKQLTASTGMTSFITTNAPTYHHHHQLNNVIRHHHDGSGLNRQEANRIVITPRPRLIADSRSTGRLHASAAHRSMTKLNIASNSRLGSVGGLHKSMTRLTSSQHINQSTAAPNSTSTVPISINPSSIPLNTPSNAILSGCRQYIITAQNKVSSGGVTVTTKSSNVNNSVLRDDPTTSGFCSSNSSSAGNNMSSNSTVMRDNTSSVISPSSGVTNITSSNINSSTTTSVSASSAGSNNTNNINNNINNSNNSSNISSNNNSNNNNSSNSNNNTSNNSGNVGVGSQVLVTPRRPHNNNNNSNNNNTSVTIINNNNTNSSNNNSNAAIVAASQRISVFEPYPMRDTVQHFCEKHLDKIKSYMEKVSVRIPPPAKCTIEERRAKKLAKLHFACQGRGEHCLYSRTFFTMRTRNPRIWIHLMFLALQARSQSALSSRDSSVSSLKNCWDILKCENKTFLTLVTSAFPCAKDQEAVLNELRQSGFCDMFSHVGDNGTNVWGCFLCNHPERAVGFLQDSQPVIEGQLKEKKGRWKIFRRWRTRYFTLSGAHLSYKGSKDDKDVTPIDVHQIRSVKVSRGARNIPKAFEIFTGDDSLILKPKGGKNAEEWVQCLSVVVAHSQSKDGPLRGSSLLLRMKCSSCSRRVPV